MPISDAPDYDSPRWQVADALTDAQQRDAIEALRTMSIPAQAIIESLPATLALATSAMMDVAQAARVAGDAFRGLTAALSNFPIRRSP